MVFLLARLTDEYADEGPGIVWRDRGGNRSGGIAAHAGLVLAGPVGCATACAAGVALKNPPRI